MAPINNPIKAARRTPNTTHPAMFPGVPQPQYMVHKLSLTTTYALGELRSKLISNCELYQHPANAYQCNVTSDGRSDTESAGGSSHYKNVKVKPLQW